MRSYCNQNLSLQLGNINKWLTPWCRTKSGCLWMRRSGLAWYRGSNSHFWRRCFWFSVTFIGISSLRRVFYRPQISGIGKRHVISHEPIQIKWFSKERWYLNDSSFWIRCCRIQEELTKLQHNWLQFVGIYVLYLHLCCSVERKLHMIYPSKYDRLRWLVIWEKNGYQKNW